MRKRVIVALSCALFLMSAYVMGTGRIVLEGSGEELLNDPRVREAYLGVA